MTRSRGDPSITMTCSVPSCDLQAEEHADLCQAHLEDLEDVWDREAEAWDDLLEDDIERRSVYR